MKLVKDHQENDNASHQEKFCKLKCMQILSDFVIDDSWLTVVHSIFTLEAIFACCLHYMLQEKRVACICRLALDADL